MAVLCFLLSAVCLSDYRNARIPNGMIAVIFLYGIGYRYWDAGGGGLTEYLFNSIVVLVLLYPLFKIGAFGAGDVKLFSVTAGCLSMQGVPCFMVVSLLISAMISLIKICRDRSGRERMRYLCSYVAGVCRTGQWKLYLDNASDCGRSGVHLAGPVLFSILLHVGGIY